MMLYILQNRRQTDKQFLCIFFVLLRNHFGRLTTWRITAFCIAYCGACKTSGLCKRRVQGSGFSEDLLAAKDSTEQKEIRPLLAFLALCSLRSLAASISTAIFRLAVQKISVENFRLAIESMLRNNIGTERR
jgi:hypothetical protein